MDPTYPYPPSHPMQAVRLSRAGLNFVLGLLVRPGRAAGAVARCAGKLGGGRTRALRRAALGTLDACGHSRVGVGSELRQEESGFGPGCARAQKKKKEDKTRKKDE